MEQLPVAEVEQSILLVLVGVSFVGCLVFLGRMIDEKRGGKAGVGVFVIIFAVSVSTIFFRSFFYSHYYRYIECRRGWLVYQGETSDEAMEYVQYHEAKTITQSSLKTGIWRYRGKWYYVEGRESNQERIPAREYIKSPAHPRGVFGT